MPISIRHTLHRLYSTGIIHPTSSRIDDSPQNPAAVYRLRRQMPAPQTPCTNWIEGSPESHRISRRNARHAEDARIGEVSSEVDLGRISDRRGIPLKANGNTGTVKMDIRAGKWLPQNGAFRNARRGRCWPDETIVEVRRTRFLCGCECCRGPGPGGESTVGNTMVSVFEIVVTQ